MHKNLKADEHWKLAKFKIQLWMSKLPVLRLSQAPPIDPDYTLQNFWRIGRYPMAVRREFYLITAPLFMWEEGTHLMRKLEYAGITQSRPVLVSLNIGTVRMDG